MNKILERKDISIKFTEEAEFYNFTNEVVASDQWVIECISNLKIHYIPPGRTLPRPLENASDEQIQNVLQFGSLTLEMVSHKKEFILNEKMALFTLKDRCGLTCKHTTNLFEKRKMAQLAEIMTLALAEYKDKKTLVLIRNGQVLAAHSANYVRLPQDEVFERFRENVLKRFPKASFKTGNYTHEKTSCEFLLSDYKDKVMKDYQEAWIDSGMNPEGLEKSMPAIVAGTSDIGVFCMEAAPIIKVGVFDYPLGENFTEKHNGTASVENIDQLFNIFFVKLKDGLKKASDLMRIEMTYPTAALVRALEKTKMTANAKKACRSLVEDFKLGLVPGDTPTAFELYMAACDIRDTETFRAMKPATKLKVAEILYQLLEFDWEKADEPGKEAID